MSDLLPILFSRGQNEGIDPRLAPPETHAVAQNVRWRKDGRPEKRYGVSSVSTAGLAANGFNTQPVNAITQWNSTPVLAVGSSVRQLTSVGWDSQFAPDVGELSHWGPGERSVIARDENITLTSPSSGYSQGMLLHAWSSTTNVYYSVTGRDGSVVVTPRLMITGTEPRVVSTANFIYVISKNGTALDMRVFDPTTLTLSAGPSPGTLDAAGDHYDAQGRGSDFLVTYQATGNITTKLFSAISTPGLLQTQTIGAGAAVAHLAVAGNATSNIFVATLNVATGGVGYVVYNNALTASLGGATVNVDPNNISQPGVVIESNTVAQIIWGGFDATTASSYMRASQVSAAGVLSTLATFYGVTPVSKPFMGPAYSTLGLVDGAYAWVSTCNANNGSTKWDTQRAYYLVKYRCNNTTPLRRQMHVPRVVASQFAQLNLGDVLDLGTGYGFAAPIPNVLRWASGSGLTATYGFDLVGFRSIYESVAMAARDSVVAGRVLQFSGGSLFEFGGEPEETDFSNFPVIQSATPGVGGALSPGTYLYKAVYEWIDAQGRRHRSAPSDPVSVVMGANNSVTLVMKPLIADAHFQAASGSIAGRGVVLHLYRTLVNQSTYRRCTPNTGAPAGSVIGAATVSYTDLISDTLIAINELLYTEGGVADNILCPPHAFQCVCSGRVWVGGQLDATVITASKLLVDGEPTQFTDLDQFSVFLPQKCTGLASIDGTVVAFSREKIYFVTGDGPNDQGVGSFNPPTELPTDVGCVDWRSVVETSLGVFFLSKRGIYLLPRGFNTPLFVGAEVAQTLASFPKIVSACVVSIPSPIGGSSAALGEITVRFVVGQNDTPSATAVLVYDLRTGGWSVDEQGSGPLLSGTWSDAFITSRLSGGVLALHSESAANIGAGDFQGFFFSSEIGTGDIRPFGIAGYGAFKSVVLMGEFRASCKLNVLVSVDGVSGDTFTFTVTSADAADGNVYFDVTPKIAKGSSLRLTCYDSGNPNATSPTEGIVMQALFIEHDVIGLTKRLAQARRA